MARTPPTTTPTYQTARLGRVHHKGPGEAVCVMELASRLAGERTNDLVLSALAEQVQGTVERERGLIAA